MVLTARPDTTVNRCVGLLSRLSLLVSLLVELRTALRPLLPAPLIVVMGLVGAAVGPSFAVPKGFTAPSLGRAVLPTRRGESHCTTYTVRIIIVCRVQYILEYVKFRIK